MRSEETTFIAKTNEHFINFSKNWEERKKQQPNAKVAVIKVILFIFSLTLRHETKIKIIREKFTNKYKFGCVITMCVITFVQYFRLIK